MTQNKDMPKEIWVWTDYDGNWDGTWLGHSETMHPERLPDAKYIRADLVPQWQPIDTAPKDGTKIDLYCRLENEFGDVKYKRYIDVQWGDLVETLTGRIYQGWRFLFDPYWEVTPTHWMPLPKPPESED